MVSSTHPSTPRGERLAHAAGEGVLPGRVGHDLQILGRGAGHQAAERRQRIGDDRLAQGGQQSAHAVDVVVQREAAGFLVQRDDLLGVGVAQRRGPGQDRGGADAVGVAGAQGQDVRGAPAGPVHRQPVDAEVVEDRGQVVGRFGESASGQRRRGAEPGALVVIISRLRSSHGC